MFYFASPPNCQGKNLLEFFPVHVCHKVRNSLVFAINAIVVQPSFTFRTSLAFYHCSLIIFQYSQKIQRRKNFLMKGSSEGQCGGVRSGHINQLELRAVYLALKFTRAVPGQDSTYATHHLMYQQLSQLSSFPLVLESLKASPYEPVQDVFKTAFFLVITSAKRVKEQHAVAINSPCMHWWPDNSDMSLWLNLGILSKVISPKFVGNGLISQHSMKVNVQSIAWHVQYVPYGTWTEWWLFISHREKKGCCSV